jgi:hypothetical protein
MSKEHGEVAEGVNIRHPSIVASVSNMTKRGAKVEEIVRLVGIPAEAVKQIQSEIK